NELLPSYKRKVKKEVQESENKRYDEEIAKEKVKLQEHFNNVLEAQKMALNEKLLKNQEENNKKYQEKAKKLNDSFKRQVKFENDIVNLHERLTADIYELPQMGGKYNIPYATKEMLLRSEERRLGKN